MDDWRHSSQLGELTYTIPGLILIELFPAFLFKWFGHWRRSSQLSELTYTIPGLLLIELFPLFPAFLFKMDRVIGGVRASSASWPTPYPVFF